MAYLKLPDEAAYILWQNSVINAATLDTMMVFVGRLIAHQTGRPYEEVRDEMAADRDLRVEQYMQDYGMELRPDAEA